MKKILALLFCFIILCQCKKDDNVIVDENFYKAFSMREPYPEVMFDSINNLIYVFDRDVGKIVCYDYQNHKVISTTQKTSFIFWKELSLYTSPSVSEVYLANAKTIFIYKGKTLEFKDSISVFPYTNDRNITGIECPNEDLLILGTCNSDLGAIAFNKKSRSIISQGSLGGYCMVTSSYKTDGDKIGVLGFGNSGTHTQLYSYLFSNKGELLDNKAEFFPQAGTGMPIKTNENIDFFISGYKGHMYGKKNLEFRTSLWGSYADFLISKSGDKLYGLSSNKELHIYDLPSLTRLKTIALPSIPVKGFIDENKLIIVYFGLIIHSDPIDVYISRFEL